MLFATPVGQPPRLLGLGRTNLAASDGYTWLSGLGAAQCRVDAKTVKFSDGSISPDSSSSLPACTGEFSASYQALQNALVALSAAYGDSRINPGSTDGVLVGGLPSNQTMGALAAAVPYLKKSKLGSGVLGVALAVALTAGATTSYVKNLVKGQMGPIATGIAAVAAMKGGGGGGEGGGSLTIATPWYKTWWGAGGLAVGAVGLLYFLTQRRSAA